MAALLGDKSRNFGLRRLPYAYNGIVTS
jgi:hypothetical protein